MDIQGAEYEAIKGGEHIFQNAIGISFEAHFFEVYENQKLFSHLHNWCTNNNFRLIYLRLTSRENFDGEVGEAAECAYIKIPDFIEDKESFLKRVLFALLWNNNDYVEFLLRNYGSVFLSKTEENIIIQKLNIEMKAKRSLGCSKNYCNGEGYERRVNHGC